MLNRTCKDWDHFATITAPTGTVVGISVQNRLHWTLGAGSHTAWPGIIWERIGGKPFRPGLPSSSPACRSSFERSATALCFCRRCRWHPAMQFGSTFAVTLDAAVKARVAAHIVCLSYRLLSRANGQETYQPSLGLVQLASHRWSTWST